MRSCKQIFNLLCRNDSRTDGGHRCAATVFACASRHLAHGWSCGSRRPTPTRCAGRRSSRSARTATAKDIDCYGFYTAIFNLLYRRIPFGKPRAVIGLRIPNPRYSRIQFCATSAVVQPQCDMSSSVPPPSPASLSPNQKRA